jgi:hypothetical protein
MVVREEGVSPKTYNRKEEHMPRGVYDRSAVKAKRSATKATKAATKATVAAEMVLSKVGAQKAAKSESVSGGADILDLRSHLAARVSAWEKIAGNTQGQHSPTLLSSLEGELVATVGSLKTWRESAFAQAAAKEEKKAPAAPAAAPAPAMKAAALPPAPLPVPAGVAPAPLPFTPAAVQEVMKQAGTN